ncbi:TPA: pentapeptide repeat-containing protein [Pseudomonas aeruginosa]
MKTYTTDEIAEVIDRHVKWVLNEAGGERADLSGAYLSAAILRGADLSGADLSGADLSEAILRKMTSMNGLIGNLREVKSIQLDVWPVTYTATHMQIGCQQHLISEWWDFDEETISSMDQDALAWWVVWKPILQQIIQASPAQPSGEAPSEVKSDG